jgi:hypothetical protein
VLGVLSCPCGARFPWADPMTREEYVEWQSAEEARRRTRKQLVALFIVSLIGVTAPLAGAVAGIQSYRYRRELAGENGPYLALGIGTAVIGLAYSLIILLLYAGF